MTYTFNLVDQKWVPCVHFDGRVEEFSLYDTLTQAHELRGIQGDSPLETAALYRLLLAILHSALRGPRTKSEWGELWLKGRWEPELVTGYLHRFYDRFDLFDPIRPFYQAADERARLKSVITLAMDMASGNNAVLFDHHTEDTGVSLSPAKAARTLIVAQTFGLAGLWLPGITFTDAPWARGIIFLVEGDNLFKTLALNLLSYPDETRNNMASSRGDQPAWESHDPHQPARQIPVGYLDYLTWQSRRVILNPEGDENAPVVCSMTMAPGLRLDSHILDPMKLFRAGKEEGYISSRFSEERVLWRDSASLFGLRSQRGNFPPKTFYWLYDLASDEYIPRKQTCRFMALGMANNQAKVEFFQEEHLPLPLAYLEQDELVELLAKALQMAEDINFSLKVACQRMALLIIIPKADGKKWQEVDRISRDQAVGLWNHWNIERFYWQQLGVPFMDFLENLTEHPEASKAWIETVCRFAWDALEHAADQAGTDAIALKAAVRARGILGNSLKELFSEPEKEVHV